MPRAASSRSKRRHRTGACTSCCNARGGLLVPVELFSDFVVKTGVLDAAAEASKLSAYRELGLRHGFVAPRVLQVDTAAGRLVTARAHGYQPLRDVYLAHRSDPERSFTAVAEAGRVLAHLHSARATDLVGCCPTRLDLPPGLPGSVRGALDGMGPATLLHGDFGFSNVHVPFGGSAPLLVLDPAPNANMAKSTCISACDVGSPAFDLALMVSCLLGRVPSRCIKTALLLPRRGLIAGFLDSYERTSSSIVALPRKPLVRFAQLILQDHLDARLTDAPALLRFALANSLGVGMTGKDE